MYPENEIRKAVDAHKENISITVKEFEDLDFLYDLMASYIEVGSTLVGTKAEVSLVQGHLVIEVLSQIHGALMKDVLNSRVKFRESFRPFTPSVLAERCNEFFELDGSAPFMFTASCIGMQSRVGSSNYARG